VRPDFRRIRLFALDFRHLAERMFFAGGGKQENRERNSDNAHSNKESHNALAQLSASGRARKDESVHPSHVAHASNWANGTNAPYKMIETRRRRITITRGGPHR